MKKNASTVMDLVIDRVKRYGPQSLAAGAAVAGIGHLVAQKKRMDEESKARESSKGVVYVDIPVDSKRASLLGPAPTATQYLLDNAVTVGGSLAAGAAGYAVVDGILKKMRKKKMEEELDSTKSQYSKLLAQQIYDANLSKQSAEIEFPLIEGLAACAADQLEEADKKAGNVSDSDKKAGVSDPTLGTALLGLPGLGALLTGILAHNYVYGKQKDIQEGIRKSEAEGAKRTPSLVKIRTVPADQMLLEGKEKEDGEDKGAFDAMLMSPERLDAVATDVIASGRKADSEKKKPKGSIIDPDAIQRVDENTIMLTTDDGDTQIDAMDPEAVKVLEQYKDIIARSFALGANMDKEPVSKKDKEE